MTFSKTHQRLLLAATVLAVPTVCACWWMLSGEPPATAGEQVAIQTGTEAGAATMREGETDAAADGKTDTDDFHAYAAELKDRGCAEDAVRELVASRITATFQRRRTFLANRARQEKWGAARIQAQLDALNREQGALIERVVGVEEQPVATVPVGVAAETTRTVSDKPPLMPAAMADEMPATVQTAEQAAEWEKMRTDFVNAIGGGGGNPADPHYLQRWKQAESESDRRFRLLYGDTAFVQHQLRAQLEARLREQGAQGR